MHVRRVRLWRYFAEAAAGVRADFVVYTVALIYLLSGAAYVLAMRETIFPQYDVYASGCLILCGLVLPYTAAISGALRIVLFHKRARGVAWKRLIAPATVGRVAAGSLLMLVMLLFVEAMYISVKTTFSAASFPYDKLVADIDKYLHFGTGPVHWYAPLRVDWLLRIVETNYDGVWFPYWLGTLYWFAASPRAEHLRVRFVTTFTLAWVLIGNVVASLCLTAGPAFYGYTTGDPARYAKLTAFLHSTGNATAATQQYLWTLHETGAGGLGSGISAFPSMHVAVSAVCALFYAEIDNRLGIAAWIYTAIIMASSVYLGWHYAVDGYAAVLLSIGIYWAVRKSHPVIGRLRFRRPSIIAGRLPPETALS